MTFKKISLLVLFCCYAVFLAAQTMTVDVPEQVAVGGQFKLSFTVNTQDVKDFRCGTLPTELEVLIGPTTSRQSSIQIVNGKTSKSEAITFTYIVCATKAGKYKIPAARVTAAGKQLTSAPRTLEVIDMGGGKGLGSSGNANTEPAVRKAGTAISGSDLFIRVSASKKTVMEQEPVLLTYKVYTLVALTELEGKMPDLQGFHTQEVPMTRSRSLHIEQFNGRPYHTTTWSQYVLFPQMTGTLKVPELVFNGIVEQRTAMDPIEALLNGGAGFEEVRKQIVAPSVEIEVKPLPDKPDGFSGAVGRFTISAQADKTSVKVGDPVTLRVVVSGVGNLQLIKQPVVEFPSDFDTYDAQTTDKTHLTAAGVEGNMVYDFLAVPRHPGDFDIPPVTFIYYDTEKGKYQTLNTDGFSIHVEKGEGGDADSSIGTQEDVELLARDIRHIHPLQASDIRQEHATFLGSLYYWVAVALLLALFIVSYLLLARRAGRRADVEGLRAGKAHKTAVKRLKKAQRMMEESRRDEFYDEVMRTLWGFVSDKLRIPTSALTAENIRERMAEKNIEGHVVDQFVDALSECEFARYAPSDTRGNMNKVYVKALTAIEKISRLLPVLLLVLSLPLRAVNAEMALRADSAYNAGAYAEAASLYEALLQEGTSADLYYNLGNAYYRQDSITRALICYERASLLAPGNEDISANLALARSKTIDRITPVSEMFFVTVLRSCIILLTADGWAVVSLCAIALALFLLLVYFFADSVTSRKAGFFGACGFLMVFFVTLCFAYKCRAFRANHQAAIVIEAAAPVKSTPAEDGTDLFIIHEGTKVTLIDTTIPEWHEVRLADGKQGWIKASNIEEI